MNYRDDVKYPETCQIAARKGVIINTVQCGNQRETTPIWQEIARRAEGSYVAIGQTGDMQIVETPVDAELSDLNLAVGRTLVPYGVFHARGLVMAKQAAAESAPASVAADRPAFNSRGGRVVQGGGDLIDDEHAGRVKLGDLKDEELPEPMRALSIEQRRAYLSEMARTRAELQSRIKGLLEKRQAFVDAHLRERQAAGESNAFDTTVLQIIREQGARKGIRFEDATPHPAKPD
jgi:hypothetical protein